MTSKYGLREIVTLLRTAEIKVYLVSRNWEETRSSRPEVLCFRGVADDRGKPIVVVIPAFERLVDFAVRAEEVVRGLAVIESRAPEAIARDILDSASSIVATELKFANLNPKCKAELAQVLTSADQLTLEVAHGLNQGTFLACVGEIVTMLSQDDNLTGTNKAKKATWMICRKIMVLANLRLKSETDVKGLWNAAQSGQLTEWLFEQVLPSGESTEPMKITESRTPANAENRSLS